MHAEVVLDINSKTENKSNKILLVDDEPLVRNTLSKYLTKMGYDVDTAEDGIVAVEKLDVNKYDLVLTDLKMPHFDGRELLNALAEKYPEIPKIVLTGFGEDKDILHALKAGANDFLYKPLGDFEILHHSIEKALEVKKLKDQKNQYYQQILQTNEIISMLNQGKTTEEIFKALSASLRRLIPFNRLTLVTLDEKNNVAITKLVDSDREVFLEKGMMFPLEHAIFAEQRYKKDPIIINNVPKFFNSLPFSDMLNPYLKEGMKSILILPLVINSEIRGYLLFSSVEPRFFQQTHTDFLKSIGEQISLSIQRGELLGDLELHTQKLERLVDIRTNEILKIQRTTIFALSKLAEMRNLETGEHLERMRKYSILTAQIYKYATYRTDISNLFLRDLYDASILHDIGKVGIPDSILLKPTPLTEDEFNVMKNHTTIGYNALKTASKDLGENSFLNMAMDVILCHHEHWDGSGYPIGLKGEEIPFAARIVTICDVYDALTSVRPYKDAYTHDQAVEIMKTAENYFDPELFKQFLENSIEYNSIREQLSGKEN